MVRKFILDVDGKTPVPCDDFLAWGTWYETAIRKCQVALTLVGDARVSTVFLGIDRNYWRRGPPLLFETMVFGGWMDMATDLYPTWEQAALGHEIMVALVHGAGGRRDVIT